MGGLMQCKQPNVVRHKSHLPCDMPPYLVSADGTYICKHHAMEMAVERMWSNE